MSEQPVEKPKMLFVMSDSIIDERGHHQIRYENNKVVEYMLNGVPQPNEPYKMA